jgi:acyl-CoA oxidase
MNVHPDLQKERSQATFDVERLTHMLDGGADRTERRRALQAIIERDPTGIFSNDDNIYLPRQERHVRSLGKHVRLIELCRILGIGNEYGGDVLQSPDWPVLCAAVADDLPTALHWIMFYPNIKTLCDEEQHEMWLPLCRDWKMIGCYAQTELGHGSNVRALETTATFLPESRGGLPGGSFIIHSPTQTATKFWPGTLGRTANHAMVMARLIDGNGVDRGVHSFLVPLRSLENHSLLPGVKTGDIGPKIGYNTMDNGFCTFDQVIIPRRNMAMRFAVVNEQGQYYTKRSANSDAASKIAYITMMQVRAHICNEAGNSLAVACTIVIRYSAVRRQGYGEPNANDSTTDTSREVQVLDYTQQQHRIFPLLASSYCFFFTGKKLLATLKQIEHRLVSNQRLTKAQVTDIHASSSALKSFTTTVTADGIEDCRKACGGHGFLACSGLPELYTTYLQNPTVEGDNHMLPQQVVKVLLKLVQAIQRNVDISDYEQCDSNLLVPHIRAILTRKAIHCPATSAAQLSQQLTILLDAFGHRAARILVGVAELLESKGSETAAAMSPFSAWNHALVEMARASRAYAQFLLLQNFVQGIVSAQDDQQKQQELNGALIGPSEANVLVDLARLWGLYWMEREMGDFLEDSYLSAAQAQWVRQSVLRLLTVIRPNAVALVDARDFSDFGLKSALGRYDGHVYPAIMKAAQREGLNQTDPGLGYEQHLKRLIVGGVGKYTGTAARL